MLDFGFPDEPPGALGGMCRFAGLESVCQPPLPNALYTLPLLTWALRHVLPPLVSDRAGCLALGITASEGLPRGSPLCGQRMF